MCVCVHTCVGVCVCVCMPTHTCTQGMCATEQVRRSEDNFVEFMFSFTFKWIPGIELRSPDFHGKRVTH